MRSYPYDPIREECRRRWRCWSRTSRLPAPFSRFNNADVFSGQISDAANLTAGPGNQSLFPDGEGHHFERFPAGKAASRWADCIRRSRNPADGSRRRGLSLASAIAMPGGWCMERPRYPDAGRAEKCPDRSRRSTGVSDPRLALKRPALSAVRGDGVGAGNNMCCGAAETPIVRLPTRQSCTGWPAVCGE